MLRMGGFRLRFPSPGAKQSSPGLKTSIGPAKPTSIGSLEIPQQPSEVALPAPHRETDAQAALPVRPMYHERVPMARISADAEALFPALPEFLKLARTHTLIPVCRRLVADLETPVSAFLRLAADEPESFLLE